MKRKNLPNLRLGTAKASAQPVIIQFFHSGFECPVERLASAKQCCVSGSSVFVPWVVKKNGSINPADDGCKIVCGGHTRRLISHDGKYVDSFYFGEKMTVTSDMKVSDTVVGDGAVKVLYRFTDIYNQEYWTEAINVK